jgi:hypothetical protein
LAITEGEDEEKFNFNLYPGNSLEFNWQEHNAQIKKIKSIIFSETLFLVKYFLNALPLALWTNVLTVINPKTPFLFNNS